MTHPRGRGHGRRGYGGRSLANRGDMRAAILALLTEKPMHGYQVIQELTERTKGVWEPSPGSRKWLRTWSRTLRRARVRWKARR